jgi:hypothetical protein
MHLMINKGSSSSMRYTFSIDESTLERLLVVHKKLRNMLQAEDKAIWKPESKKKLTIEVIQRSQREESKQSAL